MRNATLAALLGVCSVFAAADARAVPSFARQTGQDCNACHVVFPELTRYGREFKLGGYTHTKTPSAPDNVAPPIPLAGLLQVSYTKTRNTTRGDVTAEDFPRNKDAVLQEASLFYAGKVVDGAGAFVQWTYDGVEHHSALDLADIRYARKGTLAGREILWGITVNNNPSVQDVWNTTPVWSFPYAASSVAPTPAAGTLIDGALGSQVGGVGLYTWWNDSLYGEVTLYHTANSGLMRPFSSGTPVDSVVSGTAPYWRVAWEKDLGADSLMVGAYGLTARVFPDAADPSGPSNRFTDSAVDAQYQRLVGDHAFSAQATWIHERQDWEADFPAGNATNVTDRLDTRKLKASYVYARRYGVSLGLFSTQGDADPLKFGANGKPDSSGAILEFTYRPWRQVKFNLQYTAYNKFNGAKHDIDGAGRNASDNNSMYLLGWFMF